jgi:hypothetical protein
MWRRYTMGELTQEVINKLNEVKSGFGAAASSLAKDGKVAAFFRRSKDRLNDLDMNGRAVDEIIGQIKSGDDRAALEAVQVLKGAIEVRNEFNVYAGYNPFRPIIGDGVYVNKDKEYARKLGEIAALMK